MNLSKVLFFLNVMIFITPKVINTLTRLIDFLFFNIKTEEAVSNYYMNAVIRIIHTEERNPLPKARLNTT